MSTTTEISIHAYTNNGPRGCKPRQPLVHILARNGWGDVKRRVADNALPLLP